MSRITSNRSRWQAALPCLLLLPSFLLLSLLLLCLLLISGQSTAADFRVSIGGYLSSGDYGVDQDILSEDTRIYSLPVSIQARNWPWTLKLSSSYIQLNRNQVTNNNGSEREFEERNESGIGDSLLTLSHGWLSNTNKTLYTAAWFKLKIPTADHNKDLGSGEFDYEPGITISHLAEWSPFLKLSFRWRGDSAETDYDHQWKTSLGLSHKINKKWQISSFLSSREASTDRGQTSTSAYLAFGYQISHSWKVTPYAGYGLSDGSPDYAFGWNLHYRFPAAR